MCKLVWVQSIVRARSGKKAVRWQMDEYDSQRGAVQAVQWMESRWVAPVSVFCSCFPPLIFCNFIIIAVVRLDHKTIFRKNNHFGEYHTNITLSFLKKEKV